MNQRGPPPPPRSKKNRQPAPRAPPQDPRRSAPPDGEVHAYNVAKVESNPYNGYGDQAGSKSQEAASFASPSQDTYAQGGMRLNDEFSYDGAEDLGSPPPPKVDLLDLVPETTIGETLQIQGKVKFDRLLRLDGKFEGELTSTGDLIVGPKGEVVGDVQGMGEVVVFGKIMGSIAVDRLELRDAASIYGNVSCKVLRMDPSVVLVGDLNVNPMAPDRVGPDGKVLPDSPRQPAPVKKEATMLPPIDSAEPKKATKAPQATTTQKQAPLAPAPTAAEPARQTPVIVPAAETTPALEEEAAAPAMEADASDVLPSSVDDHDEENAASAAALVNDDPAAAPTPAVQADQPEPAKENNVDIFSQPPKQAAQEDPQPAAPPPSETPVDTAPNNNTADEPAKPVEEATEQAEKKPSETETTPPADQAPEPTAAMDAPEEDPAKKSDGEAASPAVAAETTEAAETAAAPEQALEA